MKNYHVAPASKLSGDLRPPSDKSISHRALLLSALTKAETKIKNLLLADDVLNTIRALQACGISIEEDTSTQTFSVYNSTGTLSPPKAPIDCGNSGTLVRLLAGIMAGQGIACRLTGDSSLCKRPMQRVVAPLLTMGAPISIADSGLLPIDIAKNTNPLTGILFKSPVASAQVKTCVLLAGLNANGSTITSEPYKSRDHTEIMLRAFNIPIRSSEDGSIVELSPGAVFKSPGILTIPADASSAIFFAVAASISQNSKIRLQNIGINPTRIGGFKLLQRMGANITIDNETSSHGELSGDISVQSSQLSGIEITEKDVPAAIDDLPAIMIAAATAKGDTIISGASELRYKECDRISAMVQGLHALGVACTERPDGVIIQGKNTNAGAFNGGKVQSFTDHRIAMSFAIASACSKKEIVIIDCDNVNTSFPHFAHFANSIGLSVSEVSA